MEVRDLRASATVAGGVLIASARSGLVLAKEGIAKMLPFLLTPIGRAAGTLAIVAMAWFGFAKHYESRGAEKLKAKTEAAISANMAIADAQRGAVKDLRSEALRDEYTRD